MGIVCSTNVCNRITSINGTDNIYLYTPQMIVGRINDVVTINDISPDSENIYFLKNDCLVFEDKQYADLFQKKTNIESIYHQTILHKVSLTNNKTYFFVPLKFPLSSFKPITEEIERFLKSEKEVTEKTLDWLSKIVPVLHPTPVNPATEDPNLAFENFEKYKGLKLEQVYIDPIYFNKPYILFPFLNNQDPNKNLVSELFESHAVEVSALHEKLIQSLSFKHKIKISYLKVLFKQWPSLSTNLILEKIYHPGRQNGGQLRAICKKWNIK